MNKTLQNSIFCVVVLLLTISCQSVKPTSGAQNNEGELIETGTASWYGPGFQGKKTANGEIFDTRKATAAHRTLPFGTIVIVKNISNGKKVEVRINDRGPFAKNRIIDLSKAAAEKIEMVQAGTATVKLYVKMDTKNLEIENIKKAGYAVQIASYQDYQNANRKSNLVPEGWVKQVIINGQKTYRVFAGKFQSVSAANDFLVKLKKQNISGFVKQVEN